MALTHIRRSVAAGTKPKAGRVWSIQQERIFAWFNSNVALTVRTSDHLIVRARAGTGKTTTIIEALSHIPPPGKILLCAFNKRIQVELESRIKSPRAEAKTLHALGFKFLREQVGEEIKVEDNVEWDRIDYVLAKHWKKWGALELGAESRRGTKKLISWAKGTAPFATRDDLLALTMDIEETRGLVPQVRETVATVAWLAMRRAARLVENDEPEISFDDMVFVPVVNGWVRPSYRWVIVDECQDMNNAQLFLARGLCREDGHLVFVGDDRQCHPAGTMIEMTGGERRPIEQVKVGEEVVSYHDCFRGIRAQGRKVLQKGVRRYAGDLLTIGAGNKSVVVTPSHRILTRLRSAEKRWALYLLEHDETSRIGCCQLMYQLGFGPSMRARHERADRAWVLATYTDREEAQVQETVTALQFGLPEGIFFEKGHMKKRLLAAIGSNRERAIRCLRHFGRRYRFPLYVHESGAHLGRYAYVTQACNLLDDVNEVRTYAGTRDGGGWKVVTVEATEGNELVYSLEVEPTEGGLQLYVADRILVHNSIYSFRGADSGCLDRLKAETKADELPLTVSYRCPRKVVNEARRLVGDFTAAPNAPDGIVRRSTLAKALPEVQAGDVILSRLNAPLVGLCLQLLRDMKPAVVAGRDIGKGLVKIIQKVRGDTIADFLTGLAVWEDTQRERIKAGKGRGVERALRDLGDQCDCLRALSRVEGITTPDALRVRVDLLFADVANRKATIVCSSIHKAKGLEWPRVFLLVDTLFRGAWGKEDLSTAIPGSKPGLEVETFRQDPEEANIEYVGLTRAMQELVLVSDRFPA